MYLTLLRMLLSISLLISSETNGDTSMVRVPQPPFTHRSQIPLVSPFSKVGVV
jgi:hypothetical protein